MPFKRQMTLKNTQYPGTFSIFVISILVYIPALSAGFIWDDDAFLTANNLILSPDGLLRIWFTTEAPDYFPLVSTSLWLEWRLWGMNAAGYHLVNVLLHAFSASLLFALFREAGIRGAWFAAVIFAVHPVNVESVAWITERKNTLTMPFYLASILFFMKFQSTGAKRAYLYSTLLFGLSLLCKTSVVMLPLVLLGVVWWKKGVITRGDFRAVIPFFLLSLLLGAVTVWFQYNRAIGDEFIRDDGLLPRFATAGVAFWFYVYKATLPLNLNFVYPRWDFSDESALVFFPALLLLLLLLVLWKKRSSWGKIPLAGLTYFLITLLPVLGFLNIYFMKFSYVADHWQYFSIIGLIGFAAAQWGNLYQRSGEARRSLFLILASLLTLFYASLTFSQAGVYKNELTLYNHIISKNKNCWMAYNNRGHFFERGGETEKAISDFNRAIEIKPDYSEAYFNRGLLYGRSGEIKQAIDDYTQAVLFNPGYADAFYNRGVLYLQKGKGGAAFADFNQTLRIDPRYVNAYLNRGTILAGESDYQLALNDFNMALSIESRSSKAYVNRGIVYAMSKNYHQAIRDFSRAITLDAGQIPAYINRSLAYRAVGNYKLAFKDMNRAGQLGYRADKAYMDELDHYLTR